MPLLQLYGVCVCACVLEIWIDTSPIANPFMAEVKTISAHPIYDNILFLIFHESLLNLLTIYSIT